MNTRNRYFSKRFSWLSAPLGAADYRHWLSDSGSLTQRLKAQSNLFSVECVQQNWALPDKDERDLVDLREGECALRREVFLYCDEQPVVFASSVLPLASLRGAWCNLGRLGSRPLGAALFADTRVLRSPLTYRKLYPHHGLYQKAVAGNSHPPRFLWARRSRFVRQGAPILVTEVFLPEILLL